MEMRQGTFCSLVKQKKMLVLESGNYVKKHQVSKTLIWELRTIKVKHQPTALSLVTGLQLNSEVPTRNF